MKKSLLITIDFPPQKGGVAAYLSNLAANLPADKIIILANRQENSQSFDDRQGYKIIRKNLYYKNFWPKWLKIYFLTRQIIKQEKIEQIVISHVLPIGYICLLLNLPYFVILHGYDIMLAQKSAWKRIWLKIIMKKSSHIIVNSSYTKEKVKLENIGDNKITTVYPCPNITPEHLNDAEKEIIKRELDLFHKKILLSVGRLVSRKGVDSVIKALPEVIKQYPNLTYLVIGNGEYRQTLGKLASELNVQGNITFISDVPDSHLPCYYDLADIFIMPSRMENESDVEGFGIVFLEANAFGKPVIAGNSGGVAEAVIDKQTGILVDPNDVSAIETAILRLFTDPEYMNKLGTQGKNRVSRDFQWDKQIEKLIKFL